MKLLKKGSPEWKMRVKASTSYNERIDYENIKETLSSAEAEDCIQVNCQHRHRSNLVAGLTRKGLIQKQDYKLSLSKDEEGEEIILIEKLEVKSAK